MKAVPRLYSTTYWVLAVFAVSFLSLSYAKEQQEETPNVQHWAFRPITKVEAPPDPSGWAELPIDQFIIAKLAEHRLRPVSQADKRTLLRRLFFDLVGLPPTPDETKEFLTDPSADAYARLVERLLASPHYGERWGRHWLDVVRYADTAGETADYPIAEAYKYRNYVINSFNKDKPYDLMIREQVAGDLLAAKGESDSYAERVTATGFIAITRRFGYNPTVEFHVTLSDTIDTLGKSFLGLNLGCARCHDHKFDPITMEDYYGLYGIFESTTYAFPGCEGSKPGEFMPLMPPEKAGPIIKAFEEELAKYDQAHKDLEAQRKTIEAEINALTGVKAKGPRIASGRLTLPGRNLQMALVQEVKECEMVVSVEAEAKAEAGIIFYAKDSANFVLANYSPHGKRIYFHEVANGSYGSFLDAVTVEEFEPPFTLKVEAKGPEVLFTVSDKTKSAKTMRRLTGAFEKGTAGLFHNVTAGQTFAKFSISRTDGTPIFSDDFSDGSKTVGKWKLGDGSPLQVEVPVDPVANLTAEQRQARETKVAELKANLKSLEPACKEAKEKLEKFRARGAPLERAYAVSEGEARNARIHLRGDPKKVGPEVPRRFLKVLGGDMVAGKGSGRLELAEWLTRHSNPLTSRVMVNRIWQHHFGQGLVKTPNNFGSKGMPPTHPELLDYLAAEFIESGWSIKAMHRLILLSKTYQLSSQGNDEASRIDPGNELYWRYARRRLDAEAFRDTVLAVSGNLDRSVGGEHPFPPKESWNYSQHTPFKAQIEDSNRRSVYLMIQRNYRHPYLELFDGADPCASTEARFITTTPAQALFLLNNAFIQNQALILAKRLGRTHSSVRERVRLAYQLAFARDPAEEEVKLAENYLGQVQSNLQEIAATGLSEKIPTEQAWAEFAQVIFASNEFMYID